MQPARVDDYLAMIAGRLRTWRGDESLTLQQVASRSGVAASTIQKVESQQMVPTIAVLFKIAQGLGRSPSDLIDVGEGAPEIVLRTAVDVCQHKHGADHITAELGDPQLSVWRMTHDPGLGIESVELGATGEAIILCERGQLEVNVAGKAHLLHPGDSLHFKTRFDLSWRACGIEPAGFLVCCTDPVGMERVVELAS